MHRTPRPAPIAILARVFLCALLLGALGLARPAASAAGQRVEIPDRLILGVRPGAAPADAQGEIAGQGGRVVGRHDEIGILVAEMPPGHGASARALLARSKRFKFVEPDALLEPSFVPNDPNVANAWHLGVMDLFTAWNTTQGSAGVPIAILDSGVDPSHPDLASKLVPGWNTYDNNSNTTDLTGHGTSVAGSAAAIGNNGIGVVGVAYANPIMPIRVTNASGWGLSSAIVSGLTWAANHGAKVANLSFAGMHSSSAITSAAQYFMSKGGLVTAAAGNYGNDDGSPENPYIVSVSATASTDVITSWSSFGSYVDVSAPGSGIWSTTNGGGYAAVSGTSFSAPVTAGVIALIFAANPGLTPQNAEQILEQSADDLGTNGYDKYYGWGRVNAGTAVFAAGGGAPPPDTIAPLTTLTSPANGAAVTGNVTISATATDNIGVTEVRFYADGQLVATDTTAPYSALWNSTATPDGAHQLLAEGYDAAQNRGSSQAVSVNVQNTVPDTTPPSVQITSPAQGSVLSGTVQIAAQGSDNDAVDEIQIYVDGQMNWSGPGDTLAVNVDTTGLPDGSYQLQARAVDPAGNVGTSAVVSVTVSNAAPPPPPSVGPTVTFMTPLDGDSVNPRRQSFSVDASSPNGMSYVQFLVDGVLQKKKDTSAPYVLTLSTGRWSAGSHVITAVAVDRAGLTAEASITITRPLSQKEIQAKLKKEQKLQEQLAKQAAKAAKAREKQLQQESSG